MVAVRRHRHAKLQSILWKEGKRMVPEGQLPPGTTDAIGTVLGRIPSGLFIITWQEDGADRTMLTSWLMQAGFEPPAVSIAVGHGRRFLSLAAAGGFRFVINQLGESQKSLLARFGKPAPDGEDPFAGLSIMRSACGAAILPDTVGWFECHSRPLVLSEKTAGDHVIVVADIHVAGSGLPETPLVHLRKSGLHY